MAWCRLARSHHMQLWWSRSMTPHGVTRIKWMKLPLATTSLMIILTLLQVMAWCGQATCHYLNQCWLSSLTPYEVTRPQWKNRHTSTICTVKTVFAVYVEDCMHYIDITWQPWCTNLPADRLLVKQFVPTNKKGTPPLLENSPVTRGYISPKASNMVTISIPRHHHDVMKRKNPFS